MRYLIIGLGIYGSNLARDLTDMGHEVIGADINPANVEAIKDYIATAYIIDAADEASLAVLPVKNVDVVIIAIGENFGASIKALALMKKMGVKNLYARAIDPLHESILENFGIQRILTPEQRAARDLSAEMALGTHVESMHVGLDHYVLKFKAPQVLVGETYASLHLSERYHLTLIAVTRTSKKRNMLGLPHLEQDVIDLSAEGATVQDDDTLIVFGSESQLRRLYRHVDI